ncbi:hypothetical protein T07_436 [Trichinella nelsoni]|uniref:Uncharacterized protein n=1 Tax=Trichinella nelsoni TaxID=6336 RepID=A0A0V0SHV3_9BILA|nr:hypothetical protein T07_436 [Trichinella nelsoni]
MLLRDQDSFCGVPQGWGRPKPCFTNWSFCLEALHTDTALRLTRRFSLFISGLEPRYDNTAQPKASDTIQPRSRPQLYEN